MNPSGKYPHVFQPIKIGNVVLKNRIMTLPMMSALSTPDGKVTSELIAYCGRMARTGAALVTIGDTAIDNERSMDHETALNLGHDFIIPGLSAVTEEIHRYGAKASIELNHGGVHSYEVLLDGKRPLGPSPYPAGVPAMSPLGPPEVEVMDKDMIRHVIQNYVNAVERCIRGGFDIVMFHAGHGWLVSQFLSPVFNRRDDEYGGSPENRMRFPLEILKAIRDKFGDKIAIDMRISGSTRSAEERNEMTTVELLAFAGAAQKYVDMINVSVSWAPYLEGAEYMCQSYYLPHMVNTCYAEMAKKTLEVPVTATGSITTIAEAEEILSQGKADIIGMGRASLADDGIVIKSYRGQEDRIRPCMRCAYCTGRLQPPRFKRIRCAINPKLGRELEYRFIPRANESKNVMIIGGGISGMQAAQTAVERGHKVKLYEKEDHLGGMMLTASALPDKYDMKAYTGWMIKETIRCGAEIILNREVTTEIIRRENPDAVLIAIGAIPAMPPIPGINGTNVVWAGDVDTGRAATGEKVIIAGSGLTGAECAIPLARENKDVTVIDMITEFDFLQDASGQCQLSIHRLYSELGIKTIFEAKIIAITEKGLKYVDKSGKEIEIQADTVINALGMKIESEKVAALSSMIPCTYQIGDCSGQPKNIVNAIESGFTYALEI